MKNKNLRIDRSRNISATALRDFKIADSSEVSEVTFRFCYDSLLKVAITICAKNNLRVKSRAGHHIKLLKKLSEYFDDEDILIISNEMRKKRNFDLYSGGILISEKEILDYKRLLEKIITQAEEYLNIDQKLF
ncbi:MAG: hypothetical protein KAS78_00140 [Candidatus Pacebacteria bacterium]|nr:hypothetical protein [Candidatus Paceibacterota bacterium]